MHDHHRARRRLATFAAVVAILAAMAAYLFH